MEGSMAAVSYKNMYSEELFPYVKKRLLQDGRKASDSTVKTAISDMFYLERQRKDKDFLSWFQSDASILEAKEEIKELLIRADRKSSNFDYDLKWYSRMLDYFNDFLKERSKNKE